MEESKAKELSYGWLKLRPRWLQFLNTPKWFLFFLCQYFFTQSIIVNGVYPGSISTIERRFGFTRLVMAHNNSLIISWFGLFKFQGWYYCVSQYSKTHYSQKRITCTCYRIPPILIILKNSSKLINVILTRQGQENNCSHVIFHVCNEEKRIN